MKPFKLSYHARSITEARLGVKATRQFINDVEHALASEGNSLVKVDEKGNNVTYLRSLKIVVVYDKLNNEVITVYEPRAWIKNDAQRRLYYTTDPNVETPKLLDAFKGALLGIL